MNCVMCFVCCFQNKSKYTVCAYSKCGKYIAAGGENGEITIWDIGSGSIIRERKKTNETDAQSITSIDWHPTNSGELAYTDNTGQFGLIENILDADENGLDGENGMAEVNDDIDFGDSKYSWKIVFAVANI